MLTRRNLVLAALLTLVLGILSVSLSASAQGGDSLVTTGSPASPFSQNKQNEPAVAVDAAHPNVAVAGSNDNIDLEACNAGDPTTCPFTAGVGTSGVYFSFDSGQTWTQPTYTGLSARDCLGPAACTPHSGPIGTVPNYVEHGLVADGDPALAFGPRPDASGHFSWANGSRLYYANLTSNLGSGPAQETFKGFEAIAVSRTDDVATAAQGGAAGQAAWMAPVVASRQANTTFSDKEQVWADNAASSPFFGNVYVCYAQFRSNSQGNASPQPLVALASSDGGSTWTQHQLTSASNNPFNPRQGFGRSGCTVRTDSNGVVYVFANQFAVGMPGSGAHLMVKSFDGGKTWTKPVTLFTAVDTCFLVQFDGTSFRCVEDGVAGARDDLSSAPSVTIANGAPTGAGATNELVDTWVDGRDGPSVVHVFTSASTDGGQTWSAPAAREVGGDRGYYSAAALSPSGHDLYLVYNAFTTPLLNDTTTPRGLVGVTLHADVGADGTLGNWTVLHRSPPGDPRGSAQNNQVLEFLGDYVYAAATDAYAVTVWNDTRNAADCPAIDAWRASVQAGSPIAHPAPQNDCPATFGNSDIFSGTFPDPTP